MSLATMKQIAFLALIITFMSCQRKAETKDAKVHSGVIERFVNGHDTLVVSVYLSGCILMRTDIINFFRISDSVYFQPEIHTYCDVHQIEKIKVKNYSALKNDTLNFDHLLRNAQETLSDKPDGTEHKSVFISFGVLHKWSKNYYCNKMTDEHSEVYRLYFEIMQQYYPAMEQFDPIGITIIEDDLLMEQ